MYTRARLLNLVLMVMVTMAGMDSLVLRSAQAASPEGIESDVRAALNSLYKATPAAKTLGAEAKGVLVFPNIVRAGFMFGAQYGEGELLKGGRIDGYYNIATASYGLQAGVQAFAYVMFFMTDTGLNSLNNSAGFEIGTGPTIVVVDAAMARSLTTTTVRDDVYAFILNQKGLMAGVSLQGSKITRIGR